MAVTNGGEGDGTVTCRKQFIMWAGGWTAKWYHGIASMGPGVSMNGFVIGLGHGFFRTHATIAVNKIRTSLKTIFSIGMATSRTTI